jgi:uridine kinase
MSSPGPRPVVVGISGASCSGKTWLANKIRDQRPEACAVIDLDGYYRDLDHVNTLEHGHDNPASIDFERLLNDLTTLKRGETAQLPVYCYEHHRIKGERECQPRPIIVLEGIFTLANPRLRDAIDIKIWMESEKDLLLARRLARDTVRGERTVEEIHERYARDVLPGYQKYILPLREYADVVIGNDGRDASRSPLIAKLVLAYVDQLTRTI